MALNYLAEILAFEQWLETHYLPILPQLLWYKMLYLCNRSGWSEWVTVDNLRLMAATQMSREATLIKARDELIKAGLIEYQKGKKGSPNRYRMISIAGKNTFKSVVQNEVESEVKGAVKPEVKRAAESADIYKQKQNKKERSPAAPIRLFEKFCEAYPKKAFGRPGAEYAYCRVLREDSHITEEDLVAAAANYAEEARILGRTEQYIRTPESFLSDSFFAGYLPGQYVRPKADAKKGKKKNSFNQFEQNSYDFAALEDELVSN
ncbi:MAG TPA: hypothetical protein DCZ91_13420 [Lachnospiraceae bacterium]|nr:hypothetical protein [Lachnospiraceae bacterium]